MQGIHNFFLCAKFALKLCLLMSHLADFNTTHLWACSMSFIYMISVDTYTRWQCRSPHRPMRGTRGGTASLIPPLFLLLIGGL